MGYWQPWCIAQHLPPRSMSPDPQTANPDHQPDERERNRPRQYYLLRQAATLERLRAGANSIVIPTVTPRTRRNSFRPLQRNKTPPVPTNSRVQTTHRTRTTPSSSRRPFSSREPWGNEGVQPR